MVNTNETTEFERKKKLFTFLPVLILPVLVLLFWALGGGQSSAADVSSDPGANGFVNTDIPGAIVEPESSKREVYRQVREEQDRRDYIRSLDPYADQLKGRGDTTPATSSGLDDWESRFAERTGSLERNLNSFTEDVNQKANISTESSRTTGATNNTRPRQRSQPRATSRSTSQSFDIEAEDEQVRKLELAMAELNSSGAVTPPGGSSPYGPGFGPSAGSSPFGLEGAPLDNPMTAQDSQAYEQVKALDRIMDRAYSLQFPETVEEEMRKLSEKNGKKLYPVGEAPSAAGDNKIFGAAVRRDTAPPAPARRQVGFFTGDSDEQVDDFTKLTVRAQVHNSIVVMDGSTIKMRLLEDVYVAGQRIPANTFVYGVGTLSGDRLRVVVSTINYRSQVYDVGLNVYDLDGQRGLAVPGSVERQIAKRQAASSASQLGGRGNGGRNLTAQLAADGTQTIKEITSRKLSVIKVELKAGHRIILRNE